MKCQATIAKAGQILLSGVIIVALSTTAHAAAASQNASFDCSKSRTKIERAICGDSNLAKLDREIAAAYSTALAQISKDGQDSLRTGQRQWLKFVDTICASKGEPDQTNRCLRVKYDDRKKQLLNAVQTIGGFTFRRVDIYRLSKSIDPDDRTGEDHGFATTEISYPVIDTPKTNAEVRFNRYIKNLADTQQKPVVDDNSTDQFFGFFEIKATSRLISVRTESGFYAHGTSHGYYGRDFVHWLLPEGRILTAGDVFKKDTPWNQVLVDRCFAGVVGYGVVHAKNELRREVEAPNQWEFGPDALTVNFNPYEVASYADGAPGIPIPWSEIRRYILPNSAVLEFVKPKT